MAPDTAPGVMAPGIYPPFPAKPEEKQTDQAGIMREEEVSLESVQKLFEAAAFTTEIVDDGSAMLIRDSSGLDKAVVLDEVNKRFLFLINYDLKEGVSDAKMLGLMNKLIEASEGFFGINYKPDANELSSFHSLFYGAGIMERSIVDTYKLFSGFNSDAFSSVKGIKKIITFKNVTADPTAHVDPMAHVDVIAHYPLTQNGNDETGNNTEMITSNNPYQDGGIYSNGGYQVNSVETPTISGLDKESFEISVDFKVLEFPDSTMPVFVMGTSYRQFGFQIESNQTVTLDLGNGDIVCNSAQKYSLNNWHKATISYANGSANLHLDGKLIISNEFMIDRKTPDDDRMVTNQDYGSGAAFKGFWRNLVIKK